MPHTRAPILALVVIAGIALVTGCVQDHKPDVIAHPDLAVVRIVDRIPAPSQSQNGYGFFASEDGLIITCLHSLPANGEIIVALSDGQTLHADLVEEDRDADVALLQVHGSKFPFLNLHDDDVEPGIHVRVVRDTSIVHGVFDHWENSGKEMALAANFPAGDVGAPVLADDGGVIGVVRFSPPGHDVQCLATPIWHITRMMPRLHQQH